jgi:hypothetical protein
MVKKPKSTVENFSEVKLLSPEEIAARRVPIEQADFMAHSHNKWHCTFCNKRFAGENTFMKHHCEPRRRMEELRSPVGQAAFGYYRDWMRARKFSIPGAAAFMESKFYRPFLQFAQMVIDANIARPDRYIEIMVEAEIQPVLWCREQCYALYVEWTDKLTEPLEQVQESVNYLMDICEKENVQLPNAFNHLGPQRVISLVRQRRLSPWLIFCSPTFGKLLKSMDKGHITTFNNIVNAQYWGERFQKERATIEQIKGIVKELGL